MKRVTIVSAQLSQSALAELKHWLAIGTNGEDAALIALLRTALEMCEAFTRTMPLESEVEEILTASREWQTLATRPVNAITGLDGLPAEGPRYTFAPGDYELDLDAGGGGRVRVLRPQNGPSSAGRIAVRLTAGLAPGWDALPDTIRHGIIRLAAHHYRARDYDDGDPQMSPPAAVTALWQPWRRMRLL